MRLIPKQVTVFHFPRHSAEIGGLPQEEKAKMNVLAAEIADGLVLGKSPILAFIIIGHADRDPQGTDFEMQVSIKRAEVAQAWLMQEARALVQQRGGDTSELNLVEFSLFGYGASDPYTQDPTFPAREMNRRIVIKYAAVELDPLPDAIGYAPNLARAVTLIQLQPHDDRTVRIQCALAKLANPFVDDAYFEWGTLRLVAGGLQGLNDDQVLAIARNIIHSLRQHIANNNLYGLPFVPDSVVVQNLLQWEQNVRTTKNKLVETLGINGVATGKVHQSVARYIARNEDNPNHIMSCFKNA